MRYFAALAYNGTRYAGWQIQPNAVSVQSTLQQALSTILETEIELVGCGRTDTGVHASQYYAHFDFDGAFPKAFLHRINKLLPDDIVIYNIFEVEPNTHARFDAYKRSYEYHVTFIKNPFSIHTTYHYPYTQRPDFDKMQAAAQLLLAYREFQPFCKSNHDAKTLQCDLTRSEWQQVDEHTLTFHISANRFLRGMVRLIVGMCLNVGLDKVSLDEVKDALDQQILLKKSWSVPPEGLFLTEVRYPFLDVNL